MTMQPADFKPTARAAPGLFATLAGLRIAAGDLRPADPQAAGRGQADATGIRHEAPPARRPRESASLSPWQVRRLHALFAARIGEPISNPELAAEVGLRVSHFTRAFRGSFGQSPHAYVLALRVDHAKCLMRSTDAPLAQVALSCGFCDQAHFSKVFRRFENATPNSWRVQFRAAAEVGGRPAAPGWPERAIGPDPQCSPLPDRRQSWM